MNTSFNGILIELLIDDKDSKATGLVDGLVICGLMLSHVQFHDIQRHVCARCCLPAVEGGKAA